MYTYLNIYTYIYVCEYNITLTFPLRLPWGLHTRPLSLTNERMQELSFCVLQGLYHEKYTSVGVMFVSIPNYIEFYDETDVNKQGLECLRLLNEIICDYDKVSILRYKYFEMGYGANLLSFTGCFWNITPLF